MREILTSFRYFTESQGPGMTISTGYSASKKERNP